MTLRRGIRRRRPYAGTTDEGATIRRWSKTLSRLNEESEINTQSRIYSTNEKDTGKTWIDKRKIYRKVIDCGALPDTTTKTVPHSIDNLAQFIKVEGVSRTPGNNVTLPLPYFNTGTGYVKMYVNASNVVLVTATDLTGYSETYVTLEYTKINEG